MRTPAEDDTDSQAPEPAPGAAITGAVSRSMAAGRPAQSPASANVPPERVATEEREGEERWLPGKSVGPYTVKRVLGKGSFGVTLLAERKGPPGTRFEKAVCLKVLRPERAADPEFAVRLLDEAKLQAALRHDNIVDVYDFHLTEGDFVIEMEFVDGVTLAQLIRSFDGGRVPLYTAAYLAWRLLRGAAWMHGAVDIQGEALQLVHRDLKPANVFLGRNGSVKIGDFGLAKGHGRQFITKDTIGRGTVRYMPPEQVEPLRPIEARADVYALGVMLYEMLSGRKHPARHHALHHEIACVMATLARPRVPLREVAPELPEAVAQLVDRMVAFDVEGRPSAAEALEALVDAVRVPVAAEEAALAERVSELLSGRPVASLSVRRSAIDEGTSEVHGPGRRAPRGREAEAGPWPRRWVMLAGGGALTLAVLAGWAGSRLLRDGVPGREELPFLPAPEEGAAVQTPGAGASSEPVFAPGSGTDTVGGVGIAAGTEAADVSRTRIASGSGGGAGGEPPIADGKAPGTAPAPGAAPAPAPRVAPSAATEGGPRAAGKPPSARAPERPEPDPAARSAAAAPDAWLDVRVRGAGGPYQVWVDGQYYGVADVAIKVPAGKHSVQVGRDAPTVTRSVRVAARARRVITVEP